MTDIADVFGLLDKWRHLPAYQLERRADIFFALYLPEVLGKHFGISINPVLIPEFPIKNDDSNKSSKVDYLAIQEPSDGRDRAFLVELKTDMASRRSDQDEVLERAMNKGMKKLLKGILSICAATNEERKYAHLLKLLSRVGLISYPDDEKMEFKDVLREIKKEVDNKSTWPCLEIVYVQPKRLISHTIGFDEFADAMGKDKEIGGVFSEHLRRWAAVKAGDPNPETPRS